MGWANLTSAAGTGTEVVGFALLAIELRKTNTSALVENIEMKSQKYAAGTMLVSDDGGGRGGIEFRDGRLGILLNNLNERQVELTGSKRLIVQGLWWAGGGLLVQLIGSIGQTLSP